MEDRIFPVTDFIFNTLNLQVHHGEVMENNKNVLILFKLARFKENGILENYATHDGITYSAEKVIMTNEMWENVRKNRKYEVFKIER